jgi:hypothetical protein
MKKIMTYILAVVASSIQVAYADTIETVDINAQGSFIPYPLSVIDVLSGTYSFDINTDQLTAINISDTQTIYDTQGVPSTSTFVLWNDPTQWTLIASGVEGETGSGAPPTVTYFNLYNNGGALTQAVTFSIYREVAGTSFEQVNGTQSIVAAPIPAAIWLFGSALIGLRAFRKNQS